MTYYLLPLALLCTVIHIGLGSRPDSWVVATVKGTGDEVKVFASSSTFGRIDDLRDSMFLIRATQGHSDGCSVDPVVIDTAPTPPFALLVDAGGCDYERKVVMADLMGAAALVVGDTPSGMLHRGIRKCDLDCSSGSFWSGNTYSSMRGFIEDDKMCTGCVSRACVPTGETDGAGNMRICCTAPHSYVNMGVERPVRNTHKDVQGRNEVGVVGTSVDDVTGKNRESIDSNLVAVFVSVAGRATLLDLLNTQKNEMVPQAPHLDSSTPSPATSSGAVMIQFRELNSGKSSVVLLKELLIWLMAMVMVSTASLHAAKVLPPLLLNCDSGLGISQGQEQEGQQQKEQQPREQFKQQQQQQHHGVPIMNQERGVIGLEQDWWGETGRQGSDAVDTGGEQVSLGCFSLDVGGGINDGGGEEDDATCALEAWYIPAAVVIAGLTSLFLSHTGVAVSGDLFDVVSCCMAFVAVYEVVGGAAAWGFLRLLPGCCVAKSSPSSSCLGSGAVNPSAPALSGGGGGGGGGAGHLAYSNSSGYTTPLLVGGMNGGGGRGGAAVVVWGSAGAEELGCILEDPVAEAATAAEGKGGGGLSGLHRLVISVIVRLVVATVTMWVWVSTRRSWEWAYVLQDLLGLIMLMLATSVVYVNSLRVGVVLVVSFCAYNLSLPWCLVDATDSGDGGGTAAGLGGGWDAEAYDSCPVHEVATLNFPVLTPMIMLLPNFGEVGLTIIGLADLMIPACLLTLLRRWDVAAATAQEEEEGDEEDDDVCTVYYWLGLGGYGVGMALRHGIMLEVGVGGGEHDGANEQQAMQGDYMTLREAYICTLTCMLLPVLVMAVSVGEFGALWRGGVGGSTAAGAHY